MTTVTCFLINTYITFTHIHALPLPNWLCNSEEEEMKKCTLFSLPTLISPIVDCFYFQQSRCTSLSKEFYVPLQ